MYGQKQLKHSSKYLILCFLTKSNSYKFGMTWRWVNDNFHFGWTNPLTHTIFLLPKKKKKARLSHVYSFAVSCNYGCRSGVQNQVHMSAGGFSGLLWTLQVQGINTLSLVLGPEEQTQGCKPQHVMKLMLIKKLGQNSLVKQGLSWKYGWAFSEQRKMSVLVQMVKHAKDTQGCIHAYTLSLTVVWEAKEDLERI